MKRIAKTKKPTPTKSNSNGKGDSPRNVSPKFKKNYEQINWKHKK
jgi:hypothetical protein